MFNKVFFNQIVFNGILTFRVVINDTSSTTESIMIDTSVSIAEIDSIIFSENIKVTSDTNIFSFDIISLLENNIIDNNQLGYISVYDISTATDSLTTRDILNIFIESHIAYPDAIVVDNVGLGDIFTTSHISNSDTLIINNIELGAISISDVSTAIDTLITRDILNIFTESPISYSDAVTASGDLGSTNISYSIFNKILFNQMIFNGTPTFVITINDINSVTDTLITRDILNIFTESYISYSDIITSSGNLGNVNISDSKIISEKIYNTGTIFLTTNSPIITTENVETLHIFIYPYPYRKDTSKYRNIPYTTVNPYRKKLGSYNIV